MNKNSVFILEDRGILFVSGEDAKEFLQNIVTNDLNKVTNDQSCFASLLSPQGKYLFDFIIVKYKHGYFLDCEKKQIDKLYNQLKIYKLRSKVEILNLSNEFVVAVISKEKFLSLKNSKEIEGFTLKYEEDQIVLDPRFKELGGRLIINLEKLYISLKKMELRIVSNEQYYNLSYKLGVPQIDTEKLQNKIFGIECNFEELNALDFKKGCYVGQENTARIKLKKKLSKKLLPIELVQGRIQEDDIIFTEDKELGKILINNKFPFAVIKFNENFEYHKEYKCGSAKIKVIRPKWLL